MSGSFKNESRQKKLKSPKRWLIATLVTSLPNSSPSTAASKTFCCKVGVFGGSSTVIDFSRLYLFENIKDSSAISEDSTTR